VTKSDKLSGMEEKRANHLERIPREDWGKTPTSVKRLVEEMAQQIEQQDKKLTEVLIVQEHLLEKINRTSENSSSPPSSDLPGFGKKPVKQKSGKKRGGQPGHKGNSRDLYPIEECSEVIEHHPEECANCRATLTGVDTNPYRHQIVEIPPISPIVIEHRLHQLTCTECGATTRATLPEAVNPSGYGVRVVALVALLSGVYRNSQRMVQSAMLEVFGISISLGTVNRLRLEASKAVATCVDEAKLYIQNANIVGADETSFNQGNIDGSNPQQRKAWLWVAVTPATFFLDKVGQPFWFIGLAN
jgi:transposase